ncbi:hypothetical protein AB0B89_10185 [Sphaerisporangium sp. NPDC049002]|uniref:hypothetical protein n=1 Tax=Sphaerisporangium sp. NPDC049002 TaxID=3155392 RepID=UPI0033C6391E
MGNLLAFTACRPLPTDGSSLKRPACATACARRLVGAGFHFDAAMRDFVATGAGRTLGEAVKHWHATRNQERGEIGAPFELNRFLREWHAAHPGSGRQAALAAWREYRSLPVDARPQA